MTRETPKAIQNAAERAALDLLRQRAAGIGEAAVLRHRLTELTDVLAAVSDEYAIALRKLRENGWSSDELRQLGLTETPTTNRAPARRPARAAAPAPRQEPAPATPAAPADVPAYEPAAYSPTADTHLS